MSLPDPHANLPPVDAVIAHWVEVNRSHTNRGKAPAILRDGSGLEELISLRREVDACLCQTRHTERLLATYRLERDRLRTMLRYELARLTLTDLDLALDTAVPCYLGQLDLLIERSQAQDGPASQVDQECRTQLADTVERFRLVSRRLRLLGQQYRNWSQLLAGGRWALGYRIRLYRCAVRFEWDLDREIVASLPPRKHERG